MKYNGIELCYNRNTIKSIGEIDMSQMTFSDFEYSKRKKKLKKKSFLM